MYIEPLSNKQSSQISTRTQIAELCCLKRATFSNKIASNPPLNQLLISMLKISDKVSQINQRTELYSQAGKMLLLNYVLPNRVQSCSLWAKWTKISMENDPGSFSPWAFCRDVHWKTYAGKILQKGFPWILILMPYWMYCNWSCVLFKFLLPVMNTFTDKNNYRSNKLMERNFITQVLILETWHWTVCSFDHEMKLYYTLL